MIYFSKQSNIKSLVIAYLCLVSNFGNSSIFDDDNYSPLQEDEAFKVSFFQQESVIEISWEIATNHYLYISSIEVVNEKQEKIEFEIIKGDVLIVEDLFFGKTSVAKDYLRIDLPLKNTDENKKLRINYQGCKKDTYCYPIISKEII